MTRARNFRPRNRPVGQAMRVILGTTTRTQILEFCPGANVGCGSKQMGGTWVADPLDVRWVFLPSAPIGRCEVRNDGDWLVRHPEGDIEVMTDAEFNRKYVAE
ncbi:hypothetical protein SEA_PUREGLOBE5_67 [Arthrobacter phage Pureglobe5]|nr:hypothetical protein PBI_BEAGLE_68 [Arthrobacter phage Beagle]QOP66817.1 hypothetical protein SEA_ODYSSEY395_68 [Arthrobacter phage Odyssey395]UYL87430.1 hypothetical protein SEA_PUREGLOBE5_67 [Arthrobacter phage Pureglobe5]